MLLGMLCNHCNAQHAFHAHQGDTIAEQFYNLQSLHSQPRLAYVSPASISRTKGADTVRTRKPLAIHLAVFRAQIAFGDVPMVPGVLIDVGFHCCITVDHWKKGVDNLLSAFLTHAHADHLIGLSETWSGALNTSGQMIMMIYLLST